MENTVLDISDGDIRLSVIKGKVVYDRKYSESFKPYTGVLTITGEDTAKTVTQIIVMEGEHHLILKDLSLNKDNNGLIVRKGATCKVRIDGDVIIKDIMCFGAKSSLKVVKGSCGRLKVGKMYSDSGLEIVYSYNKKE